MSETRKGVLGDIDDYRDLKPHTHHWDADALLTRAADEILRLRERLDGETRRSSMFFRQLEEMRDALGLQVGQTYHKRLKTLLAAEAERDAAVKARDVVEAMYHIERRRADKLQAELDARGA